MPYGMMQESGGGIFAWKDNALGVLDCEAQGNTSIYAMLGK